MSLWKHGMVIAVAAMLASPASAAAWPSLDEQMQTQTMLQRAWSALEAGNPRRAEQLFAHEERTYRNWPQTRYYVDAARGSVIAALFARDDARALKAWQTIADATPSPWVDRPFAADHLAEAGRWNDAYRAYRDETNDDSAVVPGAHDPIVSAGVARAVRGDLKGASAIWHRPSVENAADNLADLQTALIGIARAQQGDWNSAAALWVQAAREERTLPQIDSLSGGNVTALAMLVHFRNRYQRGPHNYQL